MPHPTTTDPLDLLDLDVSEGDTDSVNGIEPLTAAEELQYQQFRQERFWSEKAATARVTSASRASGAEFAKSELPKKWTLTKGIDLHDWQKLCVDAWFSNGNCGVIKVVTGAGKTILALAIAERLQRESVPQLRVAIVVPTIVLLEQWYDEIAVHGNLPDGSVGRLGGGHNDSFGDRTPILICVLNSASIKLADEATRSEASPVLLLIVDECHRAGATETQRVFRTKRAYSLGLSATPERDYEPIADVEATPSRNDESVSLAFVDTVLGRELGPVIFEMNYAEAIARGVLPPFKIIHYGLSLLPEEHMRYSRMSREITDLRSDLERHGRRGLELIRWCRSKASAGNPQAARLVGLTAERKRLLYGISERGAAVTQILNDAFMQNPECKAILFHESIGEVMSIFHALRKSGHKVVAEHSKFPDAMRAEILHLFRNGTARIIVSARSLIEGFNVPSADIGIVVAASASVRQRIQTLGRLLRKRSAVNGHEKQAVLYVLYACETVDELIYEKADWAQFVGADRNEYFFWRSTGGSDPLPQSGPPRVPQLDEDMVDASTLRPGDVYPANPDQGAIYSIDTQGTVRDEQGNLTKPSAQLKEILSKSKKALGRFRVTPKNRFVIKLEKGQEGWHGLYLGQLSVPLSSADDGDIEGSPQNNYSPGDVFPLGHVKGRTFSVLQRDHRLIALKGRNGVRFVRALDEISDPSKRQMMVALQERLKSVYGGGRKINKLTVTPEGHVVYVCDGIAYYLGEAPEGADGFMFDEKP
jgi:superfamily II DNA or RNA helicase